MPLYKILLLVIFFLLSQVAVAQSSKSYLEKQVEGLEMVLKKYEKTDPALWHLLPCNSCLFPGDTNALVPLLRTDLTLTGDLDTRARSEGLVYDSILALAVEKFQKRHGLTPDKIVGAHTIEALNIPLQTRIGQLRLNLEKWKALRDTIIEPFVLVNIPSFTLQAIDSGRIMTEMKVITGRVTHQTPEVMSQIEQVIIHPSWVVPFNISVKEILPMLREDPGYLERNNIKVYTYLKRKKIEVIEDTIQWSTLNRQNFRYVFEQIPGEDNALGKIKFIFPNRFNVYLHDTPEKHLFEQRVRTYSHGCVRLEKPEILVSWILRYQHLQDRKPMTFYLNSKKATHVIPLDRTISVCIGYFTCWIDSSGQLNFREDIYDRENDGYNPAY